MTNPKLAPDIINVDFKMSPDPHYVLETPEHYIQHISAYGIFQFFDDNYDNDLDLNKCHINYWEPTRHGATCVWRITATEFMDRVELNCLD